jgi:heme-degrading monooxygenase HmoA
VYLRFVRLKIKEEKLWNAQKFYEERVFPQLETTDGCLFASLLQGTVHGDEYISMTVWTSAEAAKRYEHGGLFDRLLDESDELLQEADEWSTDLPGAGDAVVFSGIEPEIEAWDTDNQVDDEVLGRVESGRVFVRMVAIRLREGAFEEFERRFNDEVRPTLAQTQGCLGGYLVAGVGDPDRVMSVTLWAREEDAVRYGLSGRFERLTDRLKDTFSDLYQWKLALSDDATSPTGARAPALDVGGYHLVTGRKLK